MGKGKDGEDAVVKIVDRALLCLWYADEYDEYMVAGWDAIAEGWRKEAGALIRLLYIEFGNCGPLKSYRGLHAPQYWIDYLEFRKDKFIHPEKANELAVAAD